METQRQGPPRPPRHLAPPIPPPEVIPSLDFDYLKNFHSKYYHPSNAKFWFYGDDPPERRLELLDGFLSEFDRIEVDSGIGRQPLFMEPKRVTGQFAAGEDEDISRKTMASVNWLLAERKLTMECNLHQQKCQM